MREDKYIEPYRHFSRLTDSEVGQMIHFAKDVLPWPAEREEQRLRIEHLTELYEELYKRWACADDSATFHIQGQRR